MNTGQGSKAAWFGAIAYVVVFTLSSVQAIGSAGWVPVPILASALLVGLVLRRPLVVLGLLLLGLVTAASIVQSAQMTYPMLLIVDVAVGFLTVARRARVSLPAALVALLVQVACATTWQTVGDPFNSIVPLLAVAMATTWLAGNTIRQRRVHEEVRRTQATEQAVAAERLRIAREVHDMVAHSIGVIAIQAGVGSRVIETQPAEARNALDTIEATSRETLAELRRTLGALRRQDAADGRAPMDPTPGLGDLDRLVASAADAGVRVDVQRRGTPRPLPADVDLSAYRVVQEAVTNVVRHAGVEECRVTVEHGTDEVAIEVVDAGRGGTVGNGGFGLVGMRERVGLLQGDFAAGPRPEGGFRVAVRIPVPAGAP